MHTLQCRTADLTNRKRKSIERAKKIPRSRLGCSVPTGGTMLGPPASDVLASDLSDNNMTTQVSDIDQKTIDSKQHAAAAAAAVT